MHVYIQERHLTSMVQCAMPSCLLACAFGCLSRMKYVTAAELLLQGNQRRCLTNRAAAAAAAGHSGAQIAILKQAAIGARISVWWPLDEHWYR